MRLPVIFSESRPRFAIGIQRVSLDHCMLLEGPPFSWRDDALLALIQTQGRPVKQRGVGWS